MLFSVNAFQLNGGPIRTYANGFILNEKVTGPSQTAPIITTLSCSVTVALGQTLAKQSGQIILNSPFDAYSQP